MDVGNSSFSIGTIARGPAFRIFDDDDYWASSWLVNDDSGTGARPAFIDAMNGTISAYVCADVFLTYHCYSPGCTFLLRLRLGSNRKARGYSMVVTAVLRKTN